MLREVVTSRTASMGIGGRSPGRTRVGIAARVEGHAESGERVRALREAGA
jgi:hypothetical protein